jgi:hypothetical protein
MSTHRDSTRRVLRDNPTCRGYGELMRVRDLRPFFLALTFVVTAIPYRGVALTAPVEPGFPRQTITADDGPTPLIPARSDSGSSTAPAMSTWAAPGSPTELLPLPVEAATFIATREVPRAGFPAGVERPPKNSY